MGFSIEPMPLVPFLKERRIKLPRFQRKATWSDNQKFQLCISVFKGYPVGVVIYNCSNGTQWLLDGRQRRNALKTAWEDPVNIYRYAQSFLKFKTNTHPDDITDIFWKAVNSFLQKDKSTEENSSPQTTDAEEEDVLVDIDPAEQKGNLTILLKLILMVHSIRKETSAWEKRFDFSKFISCLPYIQKGKIDSKKLKSFLLEWDEDYPDLDAEHFSEYMIQQYRLEDGVSASEFKTHIEHIFDSLKSDKDTVRHAESIFEEARIGVISLKNVSPLDAQNIFSLVNSGGTQLKAEELLSAKQFWNVPVPEQLLNLEVRTLVQNLYKDLNIPGEDTINSSAVVRWDICATLLDRIDKNHLFFPVFTQEKSGVNMTKIALGFKLVSAEATGGISTKHIEEVERCLDWENRVESLIDDVNKIAEILLEVNFYRDLIAWKQSIWDLLGHAPTLEFLAILLKNWKQLGKPTVDGTERKKFVHNSLILFDKLVYEYSINLWRGSGDSKMAHDIEDENIAERLKETPCHNWEQFVTDACKSNANYKRLLAVLFYFTILQQKRPSCLVQTSYDIDHIVPQSALDGALDTEVAGIKLLTLKDSLGNLALLPHKANVKKTDHTLNNIESELKHEVARYADISLDDFEKFSNISNLPELCQQREKIFVSVVKEKRISLFANGKLI